MRVETAVTKNKSADSKTKGFLDEIFLQRYRMYRLGYIHGKVQLPEYFNDKNVPKYAQLSVFGDNIIN
jgi:hypothetical protein